MKRTITEGCDVNLFQPKTSATQEQWRKSVINELYVDEDGEAWFTILNSTIAEEIGGEPRLINKFYVKDRGVTWNFMSTNEKASRATTQTYYNRKYGINMPYPLCDIVEYIKRLEEEKQQWILHASGTQPPTR